MRKRLTNLNGFTSLEELERSSSELSSRIPAMKACRAEGRWHRRVRKQRARAPEAVATCPVAKPLPLGVSSHLEPPSAPGGGAGAELGHC